MGVTTAKAIILRHQDERERDRLVVAISPDHGLLRIRARGSKRSTAKLAGSLEPLTEVQLSWADGRSTGLATGAVVVTRWPIFRQDMVASVSGQWLAELLEQVVKPGQHIVELYQLIQTACSHWAVQAQESLGRQWLALDRLAYQVLQLEGFVPEIDHCPRCQRSMPAEMVAYDPLVGFVHHDEAPSSVPRLTAEARHFLTTGQSRGDERTLWRSIHSVVAALLVQTIERPLKSERVLRAVFRQARLSSRDQYGMIDQAYAKTAPREGTSPAVETAVS